ncbi:MAG TPA: DNA polymerase I [bacterium]|jgi:DNA polymerase-1|nr:DNA polymerase I [bacterium]
MPKSRKLILIDANGLVYRAFFALPYFTTTDGRPTNAVFGFTNMLLKVLDDEKPGYVAAAFDKAAPTFRHEQYKEYKATRQRMPDDLRPQMQTAKQVLDALRIPIYEATGFEAEDILATIARKAAAEGFEVLIVTGDLDVLQLIDDKVRVMVTSRGITETTVYDRKKFKDRFGFDPPQLPDYKGLKGDTTDNIPGVPGVGEKTAGQLIQQFGSVEALLEHVDSVTPKLAKVIAERGGQIVQSKSLATIVTDVPVDWTWEDLARKNPDAKQLRELFERLEFKSLVERVGVAEEQPQGVYRRAENPADLAHAAADADEVGLYLKRGPGHPITATLEGIALSAVPTEGVFLSIADDRVPDDLRALLEADTLKVSGDVKADLHTLRARGLRPRGLGFDVAVASYLLNPGKRTHTLGTAAWEHLGWRLRMEQEPEENASPRVRKGVADDLGLNRDEVAESAEAADVLRRLRPILAEKMKAREVYPLFTDVEMPLVGVLADMEAAGVAVDVPYLQELSAEFGGRVDALAAEIYALAGSEFNISSPKQLGFVLFEKLQLPAMKKTKTGYSTDSEVLEYLAPQHEIVAKIVAHRELTKLLSTYVDVLPRLVNPATGRVHTTFNQTVAATGRVITIEPNLQNIPIRTEEGRKVRRAIVAPAGRLLLGVDYSQIDLRVLAHITGDPTLLEAFGRDDDIHAVTAADVFNVPRAAVTPELRRRAKTIVFGVAYGMSEFGLAAQLGISKSEAKSYIERYYARFPNVRQYMLDAVEQVRRTGYVTTLFNRRRYIPEVHTRNRPIREAAERTAINTPIQGSTADIIKKAMVDLARDVLPHFPGAMMTLHVHDELLFEVSREQVRDLAAEARRVMESAFPLSVPLRADAKVGSNWRDMEPLQ